VIVKRARIALAAILLVSFTTQSAVQAYPGDVFATASPVQAPVAAAIPTPSEGNGHRVSSDGAAEFSIPIPVAPNRQGFAPSLALSYSSRGAIRGGVAVGWSLNLPIVELDTSRGILGFHEFRSSMSRGRLVRVGPAWSGVPGTLATEEYRAREDASGTRYLRVIEVDSARTVGWRAMTTDGRTYRFGETFESKDEKDGRFHLTTISDRFSNEINFVYEKIYAPIKGRSGTAAVDSALVRIEYGENGPANLEHHARIVFDYAPGLDKCPGSQVPIGAQFDYRTGNLLFKGARRLEAIRLEVKSGASWIQRRMLDLEYDATELACQLDGKMHAPLRMLSKVTESATAPDGTVTTLPPVEFEYGRRERSFTHAVSYPGVDLGSGYGALSSVKGGGWPTVESMLLDLDGDGLIDRLRSSASQLAEPKYCEAEWQANTGTGFTTPAQFGLEVPDRPPGERFLPVMPWAEAEREDTWVGGGALGGNEGKEDCSLSAQYSRESLDISPGWAANYMSYRFMDVGGDGLPDLVTGIDSQRGRYKPEEDPRLWPDTATCSDPRHCECVVDEGPCDNWLIDPGLCPVIDTEGAPFYTDVVCTPSFCPPGNAAPSANSEPIQGGSIEEDAWDLWHHMGQAHARVDQDQQRVDQERSKEGDQAGRRNPEIQMFPETRCGQYILRVYDNLGGGRFSDTPRVVYAPVPLETDRGTSSLGAGYLAVSSSWHGFVDIDGDGVLDAIHKQPDWYSDTNIDENFHVFRGYGLGNFTADPYSWPARPIKGGHTRVQVGGSRTIQWPVPAPTDPSIRESTIPGLSATFSSVTLEDINGDGLPDYVEDYGIYNGAPRRLRVLFNTGTGFEEFIPDSYFGTQLHDTLEFLHEEQQWQDRVLGTNVPVRALGRATLRSVDIDGDGLVDIVKLPSLAPDTASQVKPWMTGLTGWQPEVYFNVGDGYVRAATPGLSAIWPALARIRLTDQSDDYLQGPWRVLTDFVDLDGDGQPEAINNEATNAQQCKISSFGDWLPCNDDNNALTDPPDGQAPRALRSIKNGRGAEITFDYASVRTANGRVPHPVWAVTSMTVSPGPDADGEPSPEMVTTYAYDHAEYNTDLEEQWGFRGFGQVSVTSPSGKKTVTTRDFSQDYGGLVVDVRTYDQPSSPTHVASIVTSQYEERRLFQQGGPWPGPDEVVTWHLTEEVQRTCGAAQDETDCAANGAIRRTTNEWRTLTVPGDSQPSLYYLFATEMNPGFGLAAGAIYRNQSKRFSSQAGKYWIVTDVDRGRWWDGVQWHDLGNTHHYFDPSDRVETSTAVLLDTQWNWTVTTRTFDMATGNLTGVKQPRYYWASGPWTTYEYDATKTFVGRTTNPLGHVIDMVTDPATGVVTESRGPNAAMNEREGWKKTIDGLGRTKAEYVWIDDAATGYKLEQIVRYTYVDSPLPRPSVTSERRHEAGGSVWTKSVVETDGLGRTVRASEYKNNAVDAVSRSYYDAADNMVLARLPHPNATNQTYVDWKYAYDALGRVIAAREPTRSGCSGEIGATSWCGTKWTYDGLVVENEDAVGTAGGQISRTRSHHDVVGRLVRVEEMQSNGMWATTTYEHDGEGNVLRTTNADGVTTVNTYDYAGRRRTTTRGGSTWVFGYDADSNLTSVQSPVPSDGLLEDHITTIAYDALGRVTSEVAARRNWSVNDDDVFGVPVVARTYDVGPNGIGRLSQVSQDIGTIDYAYDAQGRVIDETHSFSILGDQFSDLRHVQRRYGLQGQLLSSTAADATTPSAATRFTYDYDQRLQPLRTHWNDGATYKGIAENVSHNPSGRQYQRYHNRGRGGTYWDEAGRVKQHQVASMLPGETSLTSRAWEVFTFDGASDVSSLMTYVSATATGPVVHTASLSYDRMHRLVSATGPKGYTGSFDYSPGGRITAANVNAAADAARVHRRNVTYAYGPESGDQDADPDAPVRLDSVGSGTWMSVDYDLFGNALNRSEGGRIFGHFYDGFDRQRMTWSSFDAGLEVYWYGPDGQRSIVVTTTQWGAQIERVRWIVGNTEIWYRGDGTIEKQVAHTSMGPATARVEDHVRREFLYNDSRGNLLAVVGEDGSLAAGFRYGPYGEMLEQIGAEQSDFLRRFNGKEFDAASGLHYYGFRYFDERSLTWSQADPKYRATVERAANQPRRASLYAFSLGNPVSLVDPDGTDPLKPAEQAGSDGLQSLDPIGPNKMTRVPSGEGTSVVAQLVAWTVTWYRFGKKIGVDLDKRAQRAASVKAEAMALRRSQVLGAVSQLIQKEQERRQASNPLLRVELAPSATKTIMAAVDRALGDGVGDPRTGDQGGQIHYVLDDYEVPRAIDAADGMIRSDSIWIAEEPGESFPDGDPRSCEAVDACDAPEPDASDSTSQPEQ
jgi:RHS repeat-associated protein